MAAIYATQATENTTIQSWWRSIRRSHRLFFRLLSEKPSDLAQLPNLDVLIYNIDKVRHGMAFDHHPQATKTVYHHLQTAERHFVSYLQSLKVKDMQAAQDFYDQAICEVAMLQYFFMERGLNSYLSR